MDLYSETQSQFSAVTSTASKSHKTNPMSIKTKASSSRTKSSRNRRKDERKKYSTKEGSAHEDIGLITSLHQIITDVYKIIVPEVTNLIRALIRMPDQFDSAKNIQNSLIELLSEIAQKELIIWSDSKKQNIEEMVSMIFLIKSFVIYTKVTLVTITYISTCFINLCCLNSSFIKYFHRLSRKT